jgi:hypothetical protein
MLSHSHKSCKSWLGKWHGIGFKRGINVLDILTPGKKSLSLSRFGIKLGWNKKVNLTPWFWKGLGFWGLGSHVQKSFYNSCSYQHTLFYVRTTQNVGQQQKIHPWETFQASGFFRVPKLFGQNEFFFSTFWMCLKWSSSIKFSKMPKIIENQDFPRVPKLFGQKWFYFQPL